MLEIPETITLAHQLNASVCGKTIDTVLVNSSPHKFAFFFKDPNAYPAILIGKTLGKASGIGAYVEIEADDLRLTFGDGANLRYYPDQKEVPPKHQFYVGFTDGSALVVTIQMYGFISVFKSGENTNPYYLISKTKPSPLSAEFTFDHFMGLIRQAPDKLTVKGLLATEQRIPGLGNGVLQDILFEAMLHPRCKVTALDELSIRKLYERIVKVLTTMTAQGGRDTEKDLYGKPGGYPTILSAKHLGEPCPRCQTLIVKEAYLGGAVYTCPHCQPKP